MPSASISHIVPRQGNSLSLDTFLAEVEKRAYRSALLSTRQSADALDIVQDAMLQLVQGYRDRSMEEWPLLFQRILHNRITDWHRAQKRHRLRFWQGFGANRDDEEDEDPIEQLEDPRDIDPAALVAAQTDIQQVLRALETLPLRQRQVFLLRAWEGFDTDTTAAALSISSGSVKTHYFRALDRLATALAQGAHCGGQHG